MTRFISESEFRSVRLGIKCGGVEENRTILRRDPCEGNRNTVPKLVHRTSTHNTAGVLDTVRFTLKAMNYAAGELPRTLAMARSFRFSRVTRSR